MLHAQCSRRISLAFASLAAFMASAACTQESGGASDSQPQALLDVNYRSGVSDVMRIPILDALGDAGFQVSEHSGEFDSSALQGKDLLVVATALAPENEISVNLLTATPAEAEEAQSNAWRLPTPSAFSQIEIENIRQWVEGGGALLLMTDHMPFPGAMNELANAFGARLSNGFVVDSEQLPPGFNRTDVAQAATIVFSREGGSIERHSITDGASDGNRVDLAVSLTGSAIQLPPDAESLLTLGPTHVSLLPDVAWEFSSSTSRESVEGWSQLGVMQFELGRIAFMAEFGLATSNEEIRGMAELAEAQGVQLLPVDAADVQNRRLFTNTLDWLAGRD